MASLPLEPNFAVDLLPKLSTRFTRSRGGRIVITALSIAAAGFFLEAPRVILSIMPSPLDVVEAVVVTMIPNSFFQGLAITLCLELFWYIQSLRAPTAVQVVAGAILLFVPPLLSPLELDLPVSYDGLYQAGLMTTHRDFALYVIWLTAVQTVIASVYLIRRRHVFEQQTRRESVAREWQDANRGILESRMQAIQARVEPQLLFDTLSSMREFYAVDLKQGEQLLESLIEFLRRGLPRTRSVSSNVGLEIDLLKSYVELQRIAGLAKPSLTADVVGEVTQRTMAAGVLQPLVAYWLQTAGSAVEAHFKVTAQIEGSATSITVLGPRADLSEYLANVEAGLRGNLGAASVSSQIVNAQLECKLEYPDDFNHIEHAPT